MVKTKKEQVNTESETTECKGLYFKCQNCYFESKGSFCQSVKFVPLKRQSCKGCEKCSPLLEDLKEQKYNFQCEEPPIHGSVYKLSMINEVYVTDDIIDGWDTTFVLVKDEE